MPRNSRQWQARPSFPSTHFIDTRLYTDPNLFREEQVSIFAKTWIIACHESELPNQFDYRTFRHPAGPELVVYRGDDGIVRSFYNICPHRANVLVHEPAGNAHKLLCIFHAWAFDCRGNCAGITRGKEGYQDRFSASEAGLREVRTAS